MGGGDHRRDPDPTAAAIAIALRQLARRRDPVPLLFLAGAAICTLLEPLDDVLGACWYPAVGQTRLFELMGRPIPFFVLPGYVMFMGGCSLTAYLVLQTRGVGVLLRVLPLFAALEMFFEYLAVHSGTYVYYGTQPLRLLGFPLWWVPLNCTVPVAAAVIWTLLRPWLTGWRVLTVVALLPMLNAGVYAALAWPVWLTLNSAAPTAVLQGAGIATFGLAVLALGLMTSAVRERGRGL